MGPRTGLNHVEKRKLLTLPGLDLRLLHRPARASRYPGSLFLRAMKKCGTDPGDVPRSCVRKSECVMDRSNDNTKVFIEEMMICHKM
jgi:hypothetical protein